MNSSCLKHFIVKKPKLNRNESEDHAFKGPCNNYVICLAI